MFKKIFKRKKKTEIKSIDSWIKNKDFKKSEFIKRIENKNKTLFYTKKAKEFIRDKKGIIKDINKLSKSRQTKIKTKNYTITKTKSSHNTTRTYILEDIKNKKKYYIKETNKAHARKIFRNPFLIEQHFKIANNLKYLNGTREFQALKIIEREGFNIIKPELAYTDQNKTYIVYNFTSLENIERTKKLSITQKQNIQDKLRQVETEINQKLFREKNQEIREIKDIDIKNAFIDIKNKKIYLSDPYYIEVKEMNDLYY